MSIKERIKMVKAMEYICRQINDEEILYRWLGIGVADGDIQYGDMDATIFDEIDLECYYSDDDDFADLMDTFLHLMSKAKKSGGLYCDGVVSKEKEY